MTSLKYSDLISRGINAGVLVISMLSGHFLPRLVMKQNDSEGKAKFLSSKSNIFTSAGNMAYCQFKF